ncbi:hypothetical protein D9M72_569730 [compost metagenome]
MPRRRFGAYSFISATAFGIKPPQPRPAKNRKILNCSGEPASPVSKVETVNSTKLMAMPFLRPIRSASGPKISAPNIMPNSAQACSAPACGLLSPHSAISVGSTVPATKTS